MIGIMLTYLVIILNQTNISEIYLTKYSFIILAIFTGLLFLKSKKMFTWSLICLIPLTIVMLLLRFTVGGIGVGAVITFACSIVACSYLIAYNKKYTLTVFVRVCTFMAGVSVVLWLFCLLFPDVWTYIVPQYQSLMDYRIYMDSTQYTTEYYTANGLFLYSMRQVDYRRNAGIFTEPGVYQMVLNTALFVLIFMKDKLLNLTDKKIKKYVLIILITLITTQSTTGYIGGLLILLFGMFTNIDISKSLRRTILTGFLLASGLLLYDYIQRGTDSLFSVAIVEKLFGPESGFSAITVGSGGARLGTIFLALQSIMQHPFGIGYNNFGVLLNTELTGYVAASIVTFGAVWGVFTLAFVLWWLFSPVKKSEIAISAKWLFILLYFNTTLAQSKIFYTTLIIIPLSVYYYKRYSEKTESEKQLQNE